MNTQAQAQPTEPDREESLTPIETLCKRISDATGSPLALLGAIVLQAIWIAYGTFTHRDAYPFPFLLTISNILQLVLIFVIAVGQRQAAAHAETRAQYDHASITRLLYHQESQEKMLIALARKIGVEVEEVSHMVSTIVESEQEDEKIPG